MILAADYEDRHSSVKEVIKYLDPNPNLTGHLASIATMFQEFTAEILDETEKDSLELTVGLRKLLEAKDAIVRANLPL